MKDRALGDTVAISVGTAVAIEETLLTDIPLSERPEALWINIRTLARNFWGGWSNTDRPPVTKMFDAFIDEIDTLVHLVRNQRIRPVIYFTDYSFVYSKYKRANLKTIDKLTDNQRAYQTAEEALCKAALGVFGSVNSFDKYLNQSNTSKLTILVTGQRMPDNGDKAWVMSHILIDLLSRNAFSDIVLFESHTGKLRQPNQWFYKLDKKEALQHLPFNAFMLQVFGDGGVFFNSQPVSVKKAILTVAMEAKWNKMTTRSRIIETLTKIKKDEIREQALSLAHAWT